MFSVSSGACEDGGNQTGDSSSLSLSSLPRLWLADLLSLVESNYDNDNNNNNNNNHDGSSNNGRKGGRKLVMLRRSTGLALALSAVARAEGRGSDAFLRVMMGTLLSVAGQQAEGEEREREEESPV